MCRGWYQSHNDDFDWTRRLGPTWPYNTGPSSGHGGYGEFLNKYAACLMNFLQKFSKKMRFLTPHLVRILHVY